MIELHTIEKVHETKDERIARMRVKGGWIYYYRNLATDGVTCAFVPEPDKMP